MSKRNINFNKSLPMKMIPTLLFASMTFLLFTSCPNPTGDSDDDNITSTPISKFFWGSWVRMDGDNTEWYIASDGVSVGTTARSPVSSPNETGFSLNGSTIAKQTDNLLKVTPSSSSTLPFFLFRKSGATADSQISVKNNTTSGRDISRALMGMSGVNIVLKNILNPGDQHEGSTTVDGILALTDVTAGDAYTVTVPVQAGVTREVKATVIPAYDGQDLGYVIVGSAAQNFKVSYAITGNPDYLYAGQSYSLSIKIKNIGTADMLSADYFVTQPSGMSLTGVMQDILGTVKASGGEKIVTFSMNVPAFTEVEKNFEIPIRIVGVDGTEWQDRINLKFYRETISIYVRSASNQVQGIVITPDRRSIPFKTSGFSGNIILPYQTNPYILALSGADYNSETKYSVAIGSPPATNGSELNTASINEPNNNETQTTSIFMDDTQKGYLGVYDLDFYSVFSLTKNEAVTFTPSAGTYNENQSISIFNGAGGSVRYTIDGNDPTDTSTVYSSPIFIDRSITIKAKVDGGIIPESITFSNSYVLKPSTPNVTPSSIGYIITCGTTNATIRYTVDNSDPTLSSTVYLGGEVGSISGETIVKAKAWYSNWDESDIGAPSNAPVPSFTVSVGSINSVSSYDASATTDDDSTSDEIQVRWDFGAGAGWTNWSASKTATYTYASPGTYAVFLEAKDKYSITTATIKEIIVTAIPREGLTGEWLFNGNANDTSGNSNHGTVYGSTFQSDRNGVTNSSCRFDGNDRIDISPFASSFISNKSHLSVSLFINCQSSTYSTEVILGYGASGESYATNVFIIGRSTGNNIYVATEKDSGTNWGGDVDSGHVLPGIWYHLTFVFDNNTIYYYRNGYLVSNITYIQADSSSSTMNIGTFASEYFHGNIDDVRIYNRVLSENEIFSLYHENGWSY